MLNLDEFEIIRSLNSTAGDGVSIGIGDDCALLSESYGNLVITQDAMVEDVHFSTKYSTGINIANKLFNSNISDLASMGTIPKFALITAAISKGFAHDYLEDFIKQVNFLLKKYNISLIGGDTVTSKTTMFSLTLMGENKNAGNFIRHNAEVGDLICLSGYTGLSAYGLDLLKSNKKNPYNAIENHLNGVNRVDLAEYLNKLGVTSITDISDGLAFSIDLLLKKTDGAIIDFLPISPYLKDLSKEDFENYVLFGGEDYELIFTVKPSKRELLYKSIFVIGEVTDTGNIIYDNKILDARGFNHFS